MRAEMGKDPTRAPQSQLNLPPGFRFYPTDEELVVHYLCKKAACEPFSVPIIAEIELYKFDPWDLPEKALFGEKEWYFFSPRDRKYPNGSRPNRAAGSGYWKATGTDKPISTMGGSKKVGVKKALVFYKGKAPKGMKTNWIMHEYRLADSGGARSAKRKAGSSLRLDDWVLCRIYKKCSAAANNCQKPAKERSEANACLDDVLASLPEIDDRVNPLKALEMRSNGLYENSHYSPDMSGLMEQQQEDIKDIKVSPQQVGNNLNHHLLAGPYYHSNYSEDPSTTQCEPDSSLEMSNERQHSPTESTLEEDSVESTFNTLPGFMGGSGGGGSATASAGAACAGGVGGAYYVNTNFAAQPQSWFSFDGLPSPFGTSTGGFPPLQLGDGDYLNFNSADFATFMQRSIC